MPAIPTPTETVPARIDPDHTFTKRSASEIRALLDARQNDLQFRVQAIKDEFTNPSSITLAGQPLPDALREHALRNAGIAAAAGLAVGLFAGILKHRRQPEPLSDADLVRARLSSFLDDAADRVRRGASSSDAIRHALRETPVVLGQTTGQAATSQAKSSVRQAVDLAVKSAVGFALKAATDQLTQKLTGKTDTVDAVADAS